MKFLKSFANLTFWFDMIIALNTTQLWQSNTKLLPLVYAPPPIHFSNNSFYDQFLTPTPNNNKL